MREGENRGEESRGRETRLEERRERRSHQYRRKERRGGGVEAVDMRIEERSG